MARLCGALTVRIRRIPDRTAAAQSTSFRFAVYQAEGGTSAFGAGVARAFAEKQKFFAAFLRSPDRTAAAQSTSFRFAVYQAEGGTSAFGAGVARAFAEKQKFFAAFLRFG